MKVKSFSCVRLLVTPWTAAHQALHPWDFPGKSTGYHSSILAWRIPMDRGAWQTSVHGVAKSQTQLNDFTFIFHFHALEKEMATHSSVLAWKTPWTEEPGSLQSTGLQKVEHY